MQLNTNQNGFTLVELLVVVFIMSMLFALILPNFMGARERAQDAQTKQTMQGLRTALRLYYNDNNAYPTPDSSKMLNNNNNFFSNYMAEAATAGIGFSYTYNLNGDTFSVGTTLFNGTGDDDTNSQIKCGISPRVQGQYYICAK